jgi:hypothetical protein
MGGRRKPRARDALLRALSRRGGGGLAAASRVGEAYGGDGGSGRRCRCRGARGACGLPGAVRRAHRLDLKLGGVGGRAAYLLHQLVVGVYPASHIRPLLVAVPIVVLVGLFAWTARAERAGALLALGFGLAAIGPPAGLAFVGDNLVDGRGDYFIYRNLIVATVPLTIAAAAVVATPRAGKLGPTAVALTCVLLAAVSVEIARRPDLQKPDVRAVAAALGTPRTRPAIVVDVRTAHVLKLYLPNAVDAPKAPSPFGR